MKIIDLRSDTITHPTDEMRCAMYEADIGDDVFGEDPTVNALEQLAAQMLNKEAALFTSSGTMSNLLAVLTLTHPGNEILLGSEAHMFWYEVGGASTLGGVVMHTIPNNQDGQIDLTTIEEAVRGKNIHFPQTTLLCLENTHNRCGGEVLTPDYMSSAVGIALKYDLKVHLDGARIFNAAIALNVSASELAKDVDSVCFCLSKGLSAPIGSLLCGTGKFVENARKWRKMIGGGMRQGGVIAAAGIVALKTMISRLKEDHDNARQLAHGLARIPSINIPRPEIRTNIVVFELSSNVYGSDFVERLNDHGVKVIYFGGQKFRAVTHRMVNTADIDETLTRIETYVKKMG